MPADEKCEDRYVKVATVPAPERKPALFTAPRSAYACDADYAAEFQCRNYICAELVPVSMTTICPHAPPPGTISPAPIDHHLAPTQPVRAMPTVETAFDV